MDKKTMLNIAGTIWFWSLVGFSYWLLFGGGELGSPSYGLKALLWLGQ